MADIIASRIPYYVSQNTQTLAIEIKVVKEGGTPPVNPQYTVVKNSYLDGTPEMLKINISPFIPATYDHKIVSPIPSGVQTMDFNSMLEVHLNVNTVAESHESYDGYVPLSLGAGFLWTDTIKNIACNGDNQFISSDRYEIDEIKWENNIGGTETEAVTAGQGKIIMFPVNKNHIIDGATTLTVTVRKSGADIKKIRYNIVAEYDEERTYAFINKYGAWETFVAIGSIDEKFESEAKDFRRFSTGLLSTYNLNGTESIVVNTGWVDHNFKELVKQLMVSPMIVEYKHDNTTKEVVLTSKEQLFLNRRREKLVNYQFKFKYAQKELTLV